MAKDFKQISLHHIGHIAVVAAILLVPAGYLMWPTATPQALLFTEDKQFLATSKKISYSQTIAPILERRCVVCHGCYDAPCQLKLSSREGLERGISKQKIYDSTRFKDMAPTRLFIDAKNISGWRKKGFHPILNELNRERVPPDRVDSLEGTQATPEENLRQSLLYQLLRLKRDYPQPTTGRLPDDFDLALNRDQVCPTREEFVTHARKHPLWGMPYAMPGLADDEYQILVQWIAQDAPVQASYSPAPSPQADMQIQQWEALLNGTSNKERLVNRYLYEHLFQAHIHFSTTDDREFYRLVRSSTPPGERVNEIATVLPFGNPGDNPFYYRLIRFPASIVAKSHIVYVLSERKMKRIKALFFEPDYQVTQQPSYQLALATNPFKVFAAIPPSSRYRFLLDDARFFIESFIKGPVCRGQVALNSIEDQFWVMFFNPDHNIFSVDPAFLAKASDHLGLPIVRNSHQHLTSMWTEGWEEQKKYMLAKQAAFKQIPTQSINDAMKYIWDGDGENPNAALTVFRHLDSASVRYGLVGEYPETAWIIDYPLFERIHYLLVAGYNVFGSVGHQLHTRVFMDFLRMEGEDYFLAFLPAAQRVRIRDSWYQGIRAGIAELLDPPKDWLTINAVKGYQTEDPQQELYQKLQQRLAEIAVQRDRVNRCHRPDCKNETTGDAESVVENAMVRIAHMQGAVLDVLPDVSFVRVKTAGKPNLDQAYTLIHNKAYKNIIALLDNDAMRDYDSDTLTVVKGLEGSYPNFFFSVELSGIDEFTQRLTSLSDQSDYRKFVERYGVRRTSSSFWEVADWFQDYATREQPLLSGIYDLNRYHNH